MDNEDPLAELVDRIGSKEYDATFYNQPVWYQLLEKLLNNHKKDPGQGRFVTLATVKPNGAPSCRMVNCRHACPDAFHFYTDSRSHKVKQDLKHNPAAEVCWCFLKEQVQFRISGLVNVFDASTSREEDNMRNVAWKGLEPGEKQWFFWPSPGEELKAMKSQLSWSELRNIDSPPDSFCILFLNPKRVDVFVSERLPYVRQIHTRTKHGWEFKKINP